MRVQNILLVVFLIVLLVLVVRYIRKDVSTMTGLVNGKSMQQIAAASLDSGTAPSSNFTYSIWVYVDDWNYRYGERKVIFGRMNGEDADLSPDACPVVSFASTENNIDIRMATYPSAAAAALNVQPVSQTYSLPNIPLQRWVHVLISVYTRTMDLYMDGKLVRTHMLPGVPLLQPTSSVYITPTGGFSGWTSKFQFHNDATDPATAWSIYRQGYGGSLLGQLFGSTSLKVTLVQDDVQTASVII